MQGVQAVQTVHQSSTTPAVSSAPAIGITQVAAASDEQITALDSTPGMMPVAQRNIVQLEKCDSQLLVNCIAELKAAFPLPAIAEVPPNRRAQIDLAGDLHFWSSNEFDITKPGAESNSLLNYRLTIDAMAQKPVTPTKGPRIGALVGESSMLASLPELARHCDIILMLDYDHLLLHSQLKRLKDIQQCQSIAEEERFHNNLHQFIYEISAVDEEDDDDKEENYSHFFTQQNSLRSNAKKHLQQYDPFSSNERLEEIKESVKKLTIIPVYCNLFSKESMDTLSQIIRRNQGEIHILNLSNAMEYDINLYLSREFSFIGGAPLPHKHVMTLPVSKNALCCFSVLIGGKSQCLTMQPESCWKMLEQLTAERAENCGIKTESWFELLEQRVNKICVNPTRYHLSGVQAQLASASYEQVRTLSENRGRLFELIDKSKMIEPQEQEAIKSWIDRTIAHHIPPE